MTGFAFLAPGDRRLLAVASLGTAALLVSVAINLHAFCGLLCLHGHAEPLSTDICRGSEAAR